MLNISYLLKNLKPGQVFQKEATEETNNRRGGVQEVDI